MLSKIKQKKEEGFTIIEVLIVLAIAGLIMLVVFLAVPALQRNNRNTQRNNDVANILGAVNEYVNNNNGALPATSTALGSSDETVGTIGAQSSNQVDVSLGYYTADNVSIVNQNAANNDNTTSEEEVRIVLGAACDGMNADEGPSRGFVALYTLEDDAQQCRQS